MRVLLASVLSGALFGVGMVLSGMTNPVVVLAFFDIAGAWDPTLAFVMGGALLPMAIAWRVAARMSSSVLDAPMPGPANTSIDSRLLGGAALFGAGWGIVGLCPGAVVPALGFGGWPVAVFLLALLGGIFGTRVFLRNLGRLSPLPA
jgi:uncharacterized protein